MSEPVRVTTGATARLENEPSAIDSKLINVVGPSPGTATSNAAAVAMEIGRGSVEFAPASFPK